VDVKASIMASIDPVPALTTLCVSKGVLNVCKNTTLEKEESANEEEASATHLKVFPNPCTAQANIQFTLESSNWVNIKIFNLFGTEIQMIVNQFYETGTYHLPFQTNDLPVGMYFIIFQNGNLFETRKMEVIK
jgi:hypothetical protein